MAKFMRFAQDFSRWNAFQNVRRERNKNILWENQNLFVRYAFICAESKRIL